MLPTPGPWATVRCALRAWCDELSKPEGKHVASRCLCCPRTRPQADRTSARSAQCLCLRTQPQADRTARAARFGNLPWFPGNIVAVANQVDVREVAAFAVDADFAQ
jgi:hypothetical protein